MKKILMVSQNMHKNILTVVGITILFLGTCITPTVAIDNVKTPSLPISNGNTLYVGGSGPNNYTKIKDAVYDAIDGDTVFIYNGWYNEGYITINKSITIIGEDRDTTIIDGKGYRIGLKLENNSIKIYNLTIQNYYVFPDYSAGISILSRDNIICGNRIRGCLDYGIDIGYSSHNKIIRNIIENNGRGILLFGSIPNIIAVNHITRNTYGIYIYRPRDFNREYFPIGKPHNMIFKNNIFLNEVDAYFENIIFNWWEGNYWYMFVKTKVIDGLIWWESFGPGQIIQRSYVNYDLHPANKQYNILNEDIILPSNFTIFLSNIITFLLNRFPNAFPILRQLLGLM